MQCVLQIAEASYTQTVVYGADWSEGEPALKRFSVLNFLGETQSLHCKWDPRTMATVEAYLQVCTFPPVQRDRIAS